VNHPLAISDMVDPADPAQVVNSTDVSALVGLFVGSPVASCCRLVLATPIVLIACLSNFSFGPFRFAPKFEPFSRQLSLGLRI
jgi:hypothetical protein